MEFGADSPVMVGDREWQGFGVLREQDAGRAVLFDLIIDRSALPASGVVTRRYRANHNLGCYRFVGYTSLDTGGQPIGALVPLAEVRFPFDASLQGRSRLDGVPVQLWGHGPIVEEAYSVNAAGIASVRITDTDTGYSQVYGLSCH
ncbi:MAG: hypothetical protein ACOH1Y_01380 [Propionicimonas sp.]